jgi:hypothetical protein
MSNQNKKRTKKGLSALFAKESYSSYVRQFEAALHNFDIILKEDSDSEIVAIQMKVAGQQ